MALTLSTLSACGSGPGLGRGVTLHLVAADYGTDDASSSKKYWDALARNFESANPGITVDVQVIDWDHVDARVASMVEDGHAPDMAQMGSYAAFAARGKLYSADTLFPVSVQADFIPALAQAGEVNRTQYGIPFVFSSRMFFYNEKLFDAAGITRAPESWADVKAAAKKLKENGVPMPFGLPLGPEEPQAEAMVWMLGAQGGYTDATGSYTLDSQQNIDALTWVKDNLVTPGLTGTDPATTNRRDVFKSFLDGKVGMINGHPTLLAEAKAKGIKVKAVPIPGRDGQLNETLGVADWMMAFKQNGHRDEIGKFLTYAYEQKNALSFLDRYGLLPVTTSASRAMRASPRYEDLHTFLDQLPSARFYPVAKLSWGPVQSRLKQTLGKAMHEQPRTILTQMQRFAETEDNVQVAP